MKRMFSFIFALIMIFSTVCTSYADEIKIENAYGEGPTINMLATSFSPRTYESNVFSDAYGDRGYVVVHVVYKANTNIAIVSEEASYVVGYESNPRYRFTYSLSFNENTRKITVSVRWVDTEGSNPTLNNTFYLKVDNNGNLSLTT